jgi:hypothetical protein
MLGEWAHTIKPQAIQNAFILLQEHCFGWALEDSHDAIHISPEV